MTRNRSRNKIRKLQKQLREVVNDKKAINTTRTLENLRVHNDQLNPDDRAKVESLRRWIQIKGELTEKQQRMLSALVIKQTRAKTEKTPVKTTKKAAKTTDQKCEKQPCKNNAVLVATAKNGDQETTLKICESCLQKLITETRQKDRSQVIRYKIINQTDVQTSSNNVPKTEGLK